MPHADGLYYAVKAGMWQKDFNGDLTDWAGVVHHFTNGRAA